MRAEHGMPLSAEPFILVIVVLYRLSPDQSPAFQSLRQVLEEDPITAQRFRVLLYDNSPEEHVAPNALFNCEYFHDDSNPGLARAYQHALERAQVLHAPWLLLLDQDTTLDHAYVYEALATADEINGNTRIMAIVPKLVQDGTLLSPHLPRYEYPKSKMLEQISGLLDRKVAIFNSGALLRVQSLIAVQGFPQNYPLDYLDHAMFHRLYANGGQVFVLRSRLAHDLSMKHLHLVRHFRTSKRLHSIFKAESRYYLEFGNSYEKAMHRLHRIKTVMRMAIVGRFREAWDILRFTFSPF